MDAIAFFDRAYRRYKRYWVRSNLNSTDPADFPQPWSRLLLSIEGRPPGYALDLGAGEGSDAIRLARLGYAVDAVDGSAVGAEKIESFARSAGVHLNVIHTDAREFHPVRAYHIILCNGLLHYVDGESKTRILQMMQESTIPGGFNMVLLFSNHAPVPECHQILKVHCDSEDGLVTSSYRRWVTEVQFEHDKPDFSHLDFGSHSHSYIKLLARKPSA